MDPNRVVQAHRKNHYPRESTINIFEAESATDVKDEHIGSQKRECLTNESGNALSSGSFNSSLNFNYETKRIYLTFIEI
jgi:hypothetical protein